MVRGNSSDRNRHKIGIKESSRSSHRPEFLSEDRAKNHNTSLCRCLQEISCKFMVREVLVATKIVEIHGNDRDLIETLVVAESRSLVSHLCLKSATWSSLHTNVLSCNWTNVIFYCHSVGVQSFCVATCFLPKLTLANSWQNMIGPHPDCIPSALIEILYGRGS